MFPLIFSEFSSVFFRQNRQTVRENPGKVGKSLKIRARFVWRMILNSRRKYSFLPSLLKILTKIRPVF